LPEPNCAALVAPVSDAVFASSRKKAANCLPWSVATNGQTPVTANGDQSNYGTPLRWREQLSPGEHARDSLATSTMSVSPGEPFHQKRNWHTWVDRTMLRVSLSASCVFRHFLGVACRQRQLSAAQPEIRVGPRTMHVGPQFDISVPDSLMQKRDRNWGLLLAEIWRTALTATPLAQVSPECVLQPYGIVVCHCIQLYGTS